MVLDFYKTQVKDVAKNPTMHRTVSQNKELFSVIVARLRVPDPQDEKASQNKNTPILFKFFLMQLM